jgi:hypothetical protein
MNHADGRKLLPHHADIFAPRATHTVRLINFEHDVFKQIPGHCMNHCLPRRTPSYWIRSFIYGTLEGVMVRGCEATKWRQSPPQLEGDRRCIGGITSLPSSFTHPRMAWRKESFPQNSGKPLVSNINGEGGSIHIDLQVLNAFLPTPHTVLQYCSENSTFYEFCRSTPATCTYSEPV